MVNIAAVEAALEEEEVVVDFFEELVFGSRKVELENVGLATYVAAKPPMYEGGPDIWVVFEVDGKLFRLEGYYSSYDGLDWSEPNVSEVEAVQVVTTVYKKV